MLGEEDVNALMTEFPSVEADELVTKQFLRAELAELRGEIADLRNDLTLRMIAVVGAATAVLGALSAIG